MIRIFADCASLSDIRELARNPRISGFTTNPSLARKAGVTNYRDFALEALEIAGAMPVSIEVLSDDFAEMRRQALIIAGLGENAYVKIPVINSRGDSSVGLISELAHEGVRLNVTAVFTFEQIEGVRDALRPARAPVVSVFAGRLADAGVAPQEHIALCGRLLRATCPEAQVLWASSRQVYDLILAERARANIITLAPDLIAKLGLWGKDLNEFSRETVAMFAADAAAAGFSL